MSKTLGIRELGEADRRTLGGILYAGGVGSVQSLSSSAQAYLAISLLHAGHGPLLWVLESPKALDVFYQDLQALAGPYSDQIVLFPARESAPGRRAPHPDLTGDRLKALQRCLLPKTDFLMATCIQALFQPVPDRQTLAKASHRVETGQAVTPDALAGQLAELGYQFEPEVVHKGQAARRGGILDLWPPTEAWPIRLEFTGDQIESMRTFDPAAQKSLDRLTHVTLAPAGDASAIGEESAGGPGSTLTSYLPLSTAWIWAEPEGLYHHAEMCRAILGEQASERDGCDFERLRLRVGADFRGGQLSIGTDTAQGKPAVQLGLSPALSLPGLPAGGLFQPDLLDEARRRLLAELGNRAKNGEQVVLFFDTEGGRDRFIEMHGRRTGFDVRLGPLSEGLEASSIGLDIVAESDLYGIRKRLPGRYELHGRRPGPSMTSGAPLAEATDLQPGDLVVHMDHGIGKYLGLYEIDFDGRRQEVMAIEYADRAKLYVPVSQAHLLSRYVGLGRRRPSLHALGGKRWIREKVAAEQAVMDLAGVLLETQARRDLLDGHAFAADTAWQHEFEASFPYRETPDQQRAILEVKRDMESRRPMDRLVCGDVGYGKTEVALRAAFKCVQDGRQAALLVPTTVLAQQHYDTFSERLAAYPVTVEMLSRFRTRGEQKKTVERLREGALDIVIGTHRLLQSDVAFKNLGLVIIDEEQRFGVAHKEHLKRLRELVDVLTLTATPIPRTLYMSLTGARDMSTIQTPPQDRLPVETIVAQNTDEIVHEAILRELNRGGQVFYLYNRVQTIELVRQRLARLAPEARVEVGHGQMREDDLAAVMHRFVRGDFDVLLCTTIIESGVDIPNVNTILIDRADRFGLADLYQLRGRVGRYKHQAYAYFLLPRHGRLFDTARQRIGALQRHSSLGSGFKLALRDLEIRGAGNLLGSEQSGHITAVGFDLYCQLLKRTVARLKGEPAPPIVDVALKLDFLDLSLQAQTEDCSAVLPSAYVEDETLRVSLYRRLAGTATESELDALRLEWRDRFGPLPPPAERLLEVARLRLRAAARHIGSIEVREDKVMMMRGKEYLTRGHRFPRLQKMDAGGRLQELLQLVKEY